MPNIITDSGVYYHGQSYEAGAELKDVSDQDAQSLEEQGLAHRVDVKTSKHVPAEESKLSKDANDPVEVTVEMKWDELDKIAEGLGLTDLEQYGTKAELVKAIEEKQ